MDLFDAVSPEIRTRCVGYFNFTNGFFIFLGSLIGGYLAMHLPAVVLESTLLTLFLLSGIIRAIVDIFIMKGFSEVREVEIIKDREMLYLVLGITPALSLGEEVFYRRRKG